LIHPMIDSEAVALRRTLVELPRSFAALGEIAFRERKVDEVVRDTLGPQGLGHFQKEGAASFERGLQGFRTLEVVMDVALNQPIENDGKREDRLGLGQDEGRAGG